MPDALFVVMVKINVRNASTSMRKMEGITLNARTVSMGRVSKTS
jgi:hypothetical protein